MIFQRFSMPVMFAALSAVLLLAATQPAFAQAKPGQPKPGGITISPALHDITLQPGQERAVFELSITNSSNQAQEFELSLANFGDLNQTGGLLFAGEGSKALKGRYGLKEWASLGQSAVTAAPNSTVKVPVEIRNDEALKPGGHYGAVLVSPVSDGDSKQVRINQVATALLFVKKLGGEVYKLNLKEYRLETSLFKAPGSATVEFQNNGNVHLTPRGTITIKDPSGKVVRQGIINQESTIVLPESQRRLDVPLQSAGRSLLPGVHTVAVSYRYDERAEFTTEESKFLHVNGLTAISIIIVLMLLLILLFVLRQRRSSAGRTKE